MPAEEKTEVSAYAKVCEIATAYPGASLAKFLAGTIDGDPDTDDALLEDACRNYLNMYAELQRCLMVVNIANALVKSIRDAMVEADKMLAEEEAKQ